MGEKVFITLFLMLSILWIAATVGTVYWLL
ncbi:hypothetical protein PS914_06204 [Pseudomonas fluorescens]|uniref:Uncharacterized protein n=1 Tax=Pseudomonas fluorescens TaxID=294 RepID=A0A5E7FA24_PSEFL|nr:hypothetical protein PS833_05396 [Pseudomonas fluorescens]VVQ18733.1 hypothetical protein PS914_06204 [Pseudomonas fluorescens]